MMRQIVADILQALRVERYRCEGDVHSSNTLVWHCDTSAYQPHVISVMYHDSAIGISTAIYSRRRAFRYLGRAVWTKPYPLPTMPRSDVLCAAGECVNIAVDTNGYLAFGYLDGDALMFSIRFGNYTYSGAVEHFTDMVHGRLVYV